MVGFLVSFEPAPSHINLKHKIVLVESNGQESYLKPNFLYRVKQKRTENWLVSLSDYGLLCEIQFHNDVAFIFIPKLKKRGGGRGSSVSKARDSW